MNEQRAGGGAGGDPIEVRPMEAGDLEAGLQLAAAAGWNQRIDDWRLVQAMSPGANFVAISGSRLVGTTVTVNYGNRVSWIAMVLVDPALRRRGIATRLMAAALGALAGSEAVKLDATPAGREVYLGLGFVDEGIVTRLQTAAAPPPAARPAGIRPMAPADWPAVLALDERVFGTLRPALLPGLFHLAPDYAWVAEGRSGLEGFCLGRHGRRWEYLGPVTATGGEAARELALAAFGAMGGKPALVDVPEWQPEFQSWLKGRGFEEQRTFARMRKGPDAYPGLARSVFGIAGPEFG